MTDVAYMADVANMTDKFFKIPSLTEFSEFLDSDFELRLLLDMGFEPQLRKILSQVRPDRQVTRSLIQVKDFDILGPYEILRIMYV